MRKIFLFFKGKPIIPLLVLIILLFSLAFFYGKTTKSKSEVLAEVGDKKITRDDLNERIYGLSFKGTPKSPETKVSKEKEKEYVEELVEEVILEKEAPKLGVSVTDDELTTEIKKRLGDSFDSYTEEQKNITKKRIKTEVLKTKVSDKVIGWREGKFILARFDRLYEESADINSTEVIRTIGEEKVYAETLINRIYQDVIGGKITFEQGMEQANQDTKVGKPAWGVGSETYTFSDSFSKNDSLERGILIVAPDFWKEIFKVKEGEMNQPILFRINDNFSVEKIHDAFFGIIKIDKASTSSFSSYEEWLVSKKKDYNVKYFI